MKTSIIIVFCVVSSAFLFSGCSSEGTEVASAPTSLDGRKYTTFFSEGNAITRADHIRDHTVGTTALPYWEPGDEVWSIWDQLGASEALAVISQLRVERRSFIFLQA